MPGPGPSDIVIEKYTGDVYGAAKKATGIGPDTSNQDLMNHPLWGNLIRATGADPDFTRKAIEIGSLFAGLGIGGEGGAGFREGVYGIKNPPEPTNTLNLTGKLAPEDAAILSHHLDIGAKPAFKSAYESGKGNEFIQQHILSVDPTLPQRAGFDSVKYRELGQVDPRFTPQGGESGLNLNRPGSITPDPAEAAYKNILMRLPTNPAYKTGAGQ